MVSTVRRFAYLHPYTYRRLLAVLIVSLLMAGVLTAAGPKTPRKGYAGLFERKLPRLETLVAAKEMPASSSSVPTPAVLPLYASLEPSTGAVAMGYQLNAERFGTQHWPALYRLWERESGWSPHARNPLSGACGIPQALPCRKIIDMSVEGQIRWGLDYIDRRYGDPTKAWQFWQANRWY